MKRSTYIRLGPLFKGTVLLLAVTALPLSASADPRGKGHSRLIEQLTQFDGGCPPNTCKDVQFSIHRAPVCPNGPNAQLGGYSISMVREFSGDQLSGV